LRLFEARNEMARNGGFRAGAADAARLGGAEKAPQALGIAQNGRGNGAAVRKPPGGTIDRANFSP
jgi:hypothetical protein